MPRLGGAEPRPRVGGEPALAVSVGGEDAGRRAPAGQRGPGGAGLMLARQPAPERGQVKRAGVPDAAAPGVLKKRQDVALVGADGVARQGTLGGKVAAELSQRRTQRRRQAPCRAIRRDAVSFRGTATMRKVCTGARRLGTTSPMFYRPVVLHLPGTAARGPAGRTPGIAAVVSTGMAAMNFQEPAKAVPGARLGVYRELRWFRIEWGGTDYQGWTILGTPRRDALPSADRGIALCGAFLRHDAYEIIAAFDLKVRPLICGVLSNPQYLARVLNACRVGAVKTGFAIWSYSRIADAPFDPYLAAMAGSFSRLYDDLLDYGDDRGFDERFAAFLAGGRPVAACETEFLLYRCFDAMRQSLSRCPSTRFSVPSPRADRYQCLSRIQRSRDAANELIDAVISNKGGYGAVFGSGSCERTSVRRRRLWCGGSAPCANCLMINTISSSTALTES